MALHCALYGSLNHLALDMSAICICPCTPSTQNLHIYFMATSHPYAKQMSEKSPTQLPSTCPTFRVDNWSLAVDPQLQSFGVLRTSLCVLGLRIEMLIQVRQPGLLLLESSLDPPEAMCFQTMTILQTQINELNKWPKSWSNANAWMLPLLLERRKWSF